MATGKGAELLRQLRRLEERRAATVVSMEHTVSLLRSAQADTGPGMFKPRATWQEIADALGVTKQSAWATYGGPR